MPGLEELRRDLTRKIDRVEERAHQGQKKLQNELTDVKSQAKTDQAQLIRNTDQRLVESLAQASKESEERNIRMAREIEHLLNDHDGTYAHTMTSLEKRLDVKSDLLMRKLDEILNGRNREQCPSPREDSRQATDGDRAHSYADAKPRSRTNFECNHREIPMAAPSRPMFEPLNRSLETFITKLSKSTERGEKSRGHSKSQRHTRTSQMAASTPG